MESWRDKPLSRPFNIPSAREGSVKDNESEILLLKKRNRESSKSLAPVGSMLMFGGQEPPETWLLCDGSAVSRTKYKTLFSVIGTSYGGGDGESTFNLPDMRLQFPRGSGTGLGLGATGGATEHDHSVSVASASHAHTHQVTMTPSGSLDTQGSHGHSVSIPSSGGGTTGITDAINRFGRATGALDTPGVQHTHTTPNHTHTVNQSNAGGHSHTFTGNSNTVTSAAASSTTHGHTASSGNNDHLPPFVVVNYIIKA